MLLLVSAPEFENPLPLIVKFSAIAREKPFKSSDAPDETKVAPAVVPKGPFGLVPVVPSFKIPAFIFIEPLKVLFPDNVSVPFPTFVIPKAPPIIPPNVNVLAEQVIVLLAVRVIAPVP